MIYKPTSLPTLAEHKHRKSEHRTQSREENKYIKEETNSIRSVRINTEDLVNVTRAL